MPRRPATAASLVAFGAAVGLSLSGCTESSTPTPSSPSPAAPSSAATSAEPTTTTPTSDPGTSTGGPPGSEQTTPPSASGSPSFFSPTDPSSYSLSGRVAVDPARQDPFSNLLMRAALHDQPVTLDVVGTPDQPVQAGVPGTVLFGTCRCDQRGSGLRVVVEDGTAVVDARNGDIGIRGTFSVTMTGRDEATLRRAD